MAAQENMVAKQDSSQQAKVDMRKAARSTVDRDVVRNRPKKNGGTL